MSAPKEDPVDAFGWFANRKVRSGVHSASGRTHPDDDDTDYYPVPLTRAASIRRSPPGSNSAISFRRSG